MLLHCLMIAFSQMYTESHIMILITVTGLYSLKHNLPLEPRPSPSLRGKVANVKRCKNHIREYSRQLRFMYKLVTEFPDPLQAQLNCEISL